MTEPLEFHVKNIKSKFINIIARLSNNRVYMVFFIKNRSNPPSKMISRELRQSRQSSTFHAGYITLVSIASENLSGAHRARLSRMRSCTLDGARDDPLRGMRRSGRCNRRAPDGTGRRLGVCTCIGWCASGGTSVIQGRI